MGGKSSKMASSVCPSPQPATEDEPGALVDIFFGKSADFELPPANTKALYDFFSTCEVPAGPHKGRLLLEAAADYDSPFRSIHLQHAFVKLSDLSCRYCGKMGTPPTYHKLCGRCLVRWYCCSNCYVDDERCCSPPSGAVVGSTPDDAPARIGSPALAPT